jgi:RNA polymerase primary sigma factor
MSQVNDLHKVEKNAARLTQKLGRTPTAEEIAVSADISLERACSAIELSQSDVSLDAPLSGEDGDDSMQAVPAAEGPGFDEDFEQGALIQALHECIDCLDEREQLILRAYFGLQQAHPMTLGLTRERIRQLRDRALERVRSEYGDLLLELSGN